MSAPSLYRRRRKNNVPDCSCETYVKYSGRDVYMAGVKVWVLTLPSIAASMAGTVVAELTFQIMTGVL